MFPHRQNHPTHSKSTKTLQSNQRAYSVGLEQKDIRSQARKHRKSSGTKSKPSEPQTEETPAAMFICLKK